MKTTDIIEMTDKITDDWLNDEVMKHWGYGKGNINILTTASSEGKELTLDNLLKGVNL